MTTMMRVPNRIITGLTTKFVLSPKDYPATDGWSLRFDAMGTGGSLSVASVANGAAHTITISAERSSTMAAGSYSYQVVAVLGEEAYLVESGVIEVQRGLLSAAGSGYDPRPHCKVVLDAIEALLEAKATADQASMMIGSRRLDRYPIGDLLMMRDRYRAEWARYQLSERLRSGTGYGPTISVRF